MVLVIKGIYSIIIFTVDTTPQLLVMFRPFKILASVPLLFIMMSAKMPATTILCWRFLLTVDLPGQSLPRQPVVMLAQ